jgi:hypothetical protein
MCIASSLLRSSGGWRLLQQAVAVRVGGGSDAGGTRRWHWASVMRGGRQGTSGEPHHDSRFHKSHTQALFLDHGEATKQNGGGVCLFQCFLDEQWIFFLPILMIGAVLEALFLDPFTVVPSNLCSYGFVEQCCLKNICGDLKKKKKKKQEKFVNYSHV